MTNLIRAAIPNKTRNKAFTSRSWRKGTSTELAAHPDVSTDEQYCRSGWSATHYSSNGDGYFELTPVLNAPGGKLLRNGTIVILSYIHLVLSVWDPLFPTV